MLHPSHGALWYHETASLGWRDVSEGQLLLLQRTWVQLTASSSGLWEYCRHVTLRHTSLIHITHTHNHSYKITHSHKGKNITWIGGCSLGVEYLSSMHEALGLSLCVPKKH